MAFNSSGLSKWAHVTRPWSLPVSIGPAVLAGVLTYKAAGAALLSPKFAAAVFAVMFVHLAGNLYNTYFDYRYGVDTKGSECDDRALVDGMAQPMEVLVAATATIALGSCLGVAALHESISPLAVSALICGSAMALLYTGAGLKYRALGDMVILVAFGPAIMVFVSCALLDSRSHALAIPLREIGWYSLAFSALTVAVLHANNARDAKQDAKSGVVTVAMLLGPGLSYYYFILLLGVGYSTTLWASHAFSNWGAVAMLCAPLAAALVLRFRARELADMPQRVAQHNLAFMALVTIGIYLS